MYAANNGSSATSTNASVGAVKYIMDREVCFQLFELIMRSEGHGQLGASLDDRPRPMHVYIVRGSLSSASPGDPDSLIWEWEYEDSGSQQRSCAVVVHSRCS